MWTEAREERDAKAVSMMAYRWQYSNRNRVSGGEALSSV